MSVNVPPPALEALLFDVDGTLADTERDGHRVAFNMAFADAGLDWCWSEALYGELLAVTGGKERIQYYLKKHNPGFPRPDDFEGFVAQLHQAKTAHYCAMLAQGKIPLRPGIRRLLKEARQSGLRLAIATTTTPENVLALLRSSLGDDGVDWFEVIAAGDIVPAKKPAPDIYLWAMQRLGLEPAQCLAIEDSVHGVHAVHGAGIRSLVVTVNGYTRDQDFSGASLVLDHLGDPGNPCRVLEGQVGNPHLVDVALLRQVHQNAQAAFNQP